MQTHRKTRITAATAALALAVGGAVAVLPAAAENPTEWVSAGTLELSTAEDAVTFGEETQTLGAQGCDLTPAMGGLLEFTGYLGDPGPDSELPVGYNRRAIGVNEKIASLCYRVDTISETSAKTETLQLKLGADLVNFADRPLLAERASLDIEVKQTGWFNRNKARVEAEAYRTTAEGGVEQVGGTFTLIQGSGENSGGTTYCSVGNGGNCDWGIDPGGYFDTLRLTATKAAFSLEGGSDSGASPSTFDLVSEVDSSFECEPGQQYTEGTTTVTYIGNAGTSECTGFGFVLASEDQEVSYLKPLDVDPDAQFIFDVTWTKPNDGADPEVGLPTAEIDFEVAGGVGFTEMPFCPTVLYNEAGELTGLPAGTDPAVLDADFEPDALPGVQFACIASPRSAVITEEAITVTDEIYLIGDARMRW